MRGKIELRHDDLIDLLFEADDREFEKTYIEAVIKSAEPHEITYYKELVEAREAQLIEAGDLTKDEEE